MVRVVAGLCCAVVGCAVLALTACSSNSDGSGTAGSTPTRGAAPTSVLDKLTPQQLCDLVDSASIKQAVGAAPEGKDSRRSGKPPLTTTYTCAYRMGVPSLTTEVATTEPAMADRKVLDGAFTDYSKAGQGKYDPVPGFGLLAGYGPEPTLSSAEVNTDKLAVVFRIGDERLLLGVSVLGRTSLDKLKALAEELMKKDRKSVV